jgi:hypothetical protein
MTRSEKEFHDFVVGFTDPLTRLAFLLTEGTSVDAAAITIDSLAKVRRRWRDAEATGAPEPLAVEALMTGLPRQPKRVAQAQLPSDETTAPTDEEAVRELAWAAWCGLDSRHRMPLLFGDVSVASRRLAGLDVPDSLGRRHNAVAEEAVDDIRAALHGDRRTCHAVDAMSDQQLADQVAEALRGHALTAAVPADPYPLVTTRVRNLRRRTVGSVAAVVVLLAAGTVTATLLSAAKKPPQLATNHPPAAGLANVASTPGGDVAVDWPTRGNAVTDTALLSGVRALFVRAHPEATGDVRVLLATDTSAFRIAYVTASSTSGIIESWFSGPVGADDLFEGAFGYGGAVQADSVLATTLADSSGKAELVVIAPPTAKEMEIADSAGTPAGLYVPLASADGIAVKDVSPATDTSQLTLRVRLEAGNKVVYSVQRAQLGSNTVVRGTSDPGLLAAALVAADNWRRAGTIAASSVPVALWGGTDALGTSMVVVRLRTGDPNDGLLVEWSDATATGSARPAVPPNRTLDRPLNRHYGVGHGQPDFPLAFRYGSAQVGVVVPAGIATAVLVVNGDEVPPVSVDAAGFASIPVPGSAGSATDVTLRVNLYDATGGIIRTLPVPLPA